MIFHVCKRLNMDLERLSAIYPNMNLKCNFKEDKNETNKSNNRTKR